MEEKPSRKTSDILIYSYIFMDAAKLSNCTARPGKGCTVVFAIFSSFFHFLSRKLFKIVYSLATWAAQKSFLTLHIKPFIAYFRAALSAFKFHS